MRYEVIYNIIMYSSLQATTKKKKKWIFKAVMSIVVNDIGSKLICRICVSDCALLLGSVKAKYKQDKEKFLTNKFKNHE